MRPAAMQCAPVPTDCHVASSSFLLSSSPSAAANDAAAGIDALSLDEKTRAAAEADPEFAAALERKRLRDLEEAKMLFRSRTRRPA
ncbi:hypothetical protein NMY22_g19138 [Coprinellus aureogranulatus]|nr:hypothetical protein NMY22_g19138 [Coprinellus aureogranulatus]